MALLGVGMGLLASQIESAPLEDETQVAIVESYESAQAEKDADSTVSDEESRPTVV